MPKGNAKLNTATNMFNAQSFLINQALLGVNTAEPVVVTAVSNGFVDVKQMVNNVDGDGNSIESQEIYSLPFIRLQAGNSGIIIDPKVGDIGLAVYCQRDITSFKSSKKSALPNTKRFMDKADGVFIGGLGNINSTPQRLIQFTDDGIIITGLNNVTINGTTTINGDTTINGNTNISGNTTIGGDNTVSGNVTASDCISGGISGKGHTHTDSMGGTTTPPQ